jgi:hypothetical protein
MASHSGSIALAIVGLVFVLYFRRAIFGLIFGVFGLMLLAAALAIVVSVAVLIHRYFGFVAAGISTAVMLYSLFAICRTSGSGGRSYSNDNGWDDDEENERRMRDDQLQEDRRQQQIHDDAIHRNPW